MGKTGKRVRVFITFLRVSAATLSSYLLGYLLTALLVLVGIIAAFLGMRGFIRRGLVFWGNLLFWLVGRRLHAYGTEHITPRKTYLVLANHSSLYDIPALLALMPDVSLVGREMLTRIPVFKRILRELRYIPIDTENIHRAHDAIAEAVKRAREGRSIGMFPEGTRTLTGKVQRLKRGFVYVLRESGLDVLPVTIRGTFALKPKGRVTMDPRERIEAFIHPPIRNSELAGLGDQAIMERIRTVLEYPKEGVDEGI
jgi:1-acyl-sn-glycerol-3-phosphate acyltransferase